MPLSLSNVLRKCFRRDPTERWATMAEVADELRVVYREELGRDYPRPVPEAMRDDDRDGPLERRMSTGIEWTAPREWFIKALEAEDRAPSEVDALLPPQASSYKAQAIADLVAYEDARRMFEGLI